MLYPLRQKNVRRLNELYAQLPAVACKGLCVDACGPVLMSRIEWMRLANHLNADPFEHATTETCPMLEDGRCSAYEVRPFICRIYGVAEGLPCPFGCVPERVVPDAEASEMLNLLDAIGGEGLYCTHQPGGRVDARKRP